MPLSLTPVHDLRVKRYATRPRPPHDNDLGSVRRHALTKNTGGGYDARTNSTPAGNGGIGMRRLVLPASLALCVLLAGCSSADNTNGNANANAANTANRAVTPAPTPAATAANANNANSNANSNVHANMNAREHANMNMNGNARGNANHNR